MKNNEINIQSINTHKFKTNCIYFFIIQKLDRKYVTYNALISKILIMGCKKYKTIRDINVKMEEMYGSSISSNILKKGNYQIIEFLIEFNSYKVKLEEIITFLKDIILNPLVEDEGFKKEYFEKAKQIVKNNIILRQNDKKQFAKDRCIQIMFENENFGILEDGYIEDLNSNINSKILYSHYKNILQTSKIDIFTIGDIKKDIIIPLIKENFNINYKYFLNLEENFIYKSKKQTKEIIEHFNIAQGKLCMTYRCNIPPNDRLLVPLLLANEILGGGSNSILFNNLREKQNLCYYITSSIFIFKSIIIIESGIDSEQYENVKKQINENVKNIIKCNFNNEIINNAKNNLSKKYKQILDYNKTTIDYYYTNYLLQIQIPIEKIIEKIQLVTKSDIKESLKNIYLDTCYFMKGDEN